jgi:hypothetical protein
MADEVRPGALVGWKFRSGLVLGHVKSVEKNGDVLKMTPVSKPESTVTRRREKVLLEREMDKQDVEVAMQRGGHMARTQTKSRSTKAKQMGLAQPHQARRARRGCAAGLAQLGCASLTVLRAVRCDAMRADAARAGGARGQAQAAGGVRGGGGRAQAAPHARRQEGGGGGGGGGSADAHADEST